MANLITSRQESNWQFIAERAQLYIAFQFLEHASAHWVVSRDSTAAQKGSHIACPGNALMRHLRWHAARAVVKVKHPANPRHRSRLPQARTVIYGMLRSQTTYQFPVLSP